MAASIDLVTSTEVKTYLGISGSTHDTLITELIDLVSEYIEDYCNTYFSSVAVTDKHDGGGEFLFVTKAPIISITSITDNLDSTVVAATDYDAYLKSGRIYRESNTTLWTSNEPRWFEGRQRFTIVYQAGHAVIPEAVKWVAYTLIGRHLKILPTSNASGQWNQPPIMDMEDDSSRKKLIAFTPQERKLLAPYRNLEV
jgi:hypothetical protein